MLSSDVHSSLQQQPLPAALIIAGGRGTRFWPESRIGNPKPLFAIDGKTSLLEATISRTSALIPKEQIFVLVPKEQHRPFMRVVQKLLPAANLITEPEGRGTAVAITYGCGVIANRLGIDAIVLAIPADHYIEPIDAYAATLSSAVSLAASHHAMVVIGVAPARAESGYGYMKVGPRVDGGFRVERFVEKPPIDIARQMVHSGNFFWNAGMFVMPIATLAAELEREAPTLARAMRELPQAKPQQRARLYGTFNFDSFDRVIAEKAQGLLGVRATFRWHDVGSWEGLWDALRGGGQNVLSGNVIALQSNGVFARANGRPIVLLGVNDLLAVDTGDIILIARRSRSQEVSMVIDELKRRGLDRYL